MTSARYNPPQPMSFRPRWFFAAALLLLAAISVRAASFEAPAADLARQIAALAGPGPARLVILNNSTLPTGEIPVIRRSLEQDLRGLGVLPGGAQSATVIRVTLSQNARGGLWVAEVREGTEVRVAMVPVSLDVSVAGSGGAALTLRRTLLLSEPQQILDAALFVRGGEQRLVVLEPERILVFTRNAGAITAPGASPAWNQPQTFPVEHTRSYPRDVRGRIVAAQDHFFDAYLPGMQCTATDNGAQVAVSCAESDDPWQVTSTQRGFYNSMRDNFTGVLAPGFCMRLPPFYCAAEVPRIGGAATLLNTVSGKVLLIDNGVEKPITGADDWGSDFAVVRSGCGSGAQVLVSGSGAATAGDSLRAFEVPGREAIPVSAAVPVNGVIESLSTAPDGTTATMIVQRDTPTGWEVWNVAAICN